jgi:threonine dehydratase
VEIAHEARSFACVLQNEMPILAAEVWAAEERLRGATVRETPLEESSWLSQAGDCRALLKLENLQVTGSFKARGAANKVTRKWYLLSAWIKMSVQPDA